MAEPRGAIAGTFLAGELKAGEIQYPFDPPELVLLPKLPSIRSEPYTALAFVRPKLELLAKQTDTVLQSVVTPGIPRLELTARPVGAQVPPVALAQKPLLQLTSRPFTFVNDVTLVVGRPQLELFAKRAHGFVPGLSPSEPEDWTLVATTPLEETLVVAVVEDEYLTPSIEVPA